MRCRNCNHRQISYHGYIGSGHHSDQLDKRDFAWWRRQMKTFSALLAFCVGNSPGTGEFPPQRPVTRSFVFSLICPWTKCWANNRDAGDLNRHHDHYDVTVMESKRPLVASEAVHLSTLIFAIHIAWRYQDITWGNFDLLWWGSQHSPEVNFSGNLSDNSN